jgi:hypothetical protein
MRRAVSSSLARAILMIASPSISSSLRVSDCDGIVLTVDDEGKLDDEKRKALAKEHPRILFCDVMELSRTLELALQALRRKSEALQELAKLEAAGVQVPSDVRSAAEADTRFSQLDIVETALRDLNLVGKTEGLLAEVVNHNSAAKRVQIEAGRQLGGDREL